MSPFIIYQAKGTGDRPGVHRLDSTEVMLTGTVQLSSVVERYGEPELKSSSYISQNSGRNTDSQEEFFPPQLEPVVLIRLLVTSTHPDTFVDLVVDLETTDLTASLLTQGDQATFVCSVTALASGENSDDQSTGGTGNSSWQLAPCDYTITPPS